jgi:predicted dehydrogenase
MRPDQSTNRENVTRAGVWRFTALERAARPPFTLIEEASMPKPLSVLVVGAGTMARVHATALLDIDGVELAGIVNDHGASAKRLAAEVGTRAFKNLTQALRATQADAVFVCLPTTQHRAAVTEAARAGLHVFCEKPMARSVADAEAMIEVCAKENVVLMVGHVLRFFPQYAKLHERVAKGDVGKPAMARLSRGGAAPRGARNWYAKRVDSGGVLLDLVIHDFDWLVWTFGPVLRVHARQTTPRAGKLSAYALAVLRHASGVISHVEGFWGHELPFRTRVEVAGDKGALEYDSLHPVPVELHRVDKSSARSGVVLPESPLARGPFLLENEHFVDCVRRRVAPDPSPADALAALRVSLACLSSARTGEVVTL